MSPQAPFGSSCGGVALSWPRHTCAAQLVSEAARTSSISVRCNQNTSFGSLITPACWSRRPISRSMRRTCGHASPTSASASSRIGAAPAPSAATGGRPCAYRIQPRQHRSRRLLPAGREAPLPLVRIDALPADEEPQGLQQRNRVVGRHRIHEVEVVDRVPVRAEVGLETRVPLMPHRIVRGGRPLQEFLRWQSKQRLCSSCWLRVQVARS